MCKLVLAAWTLALLAALACPRSYAGEPQTIASDDSVMVGKVVAIDLDAGTFTMLDGAGNETTLSSPNPEILRELLPGSVATVAYHRAVAVDIQPEGEHAAYQLQQSVAPSQEANAGGDREIVTVLAPITAIDTRRHILSVRGPSGRITELDVAGKEDRRRLHKLEVGQVLRVRFTHARLVHLQSASIPDAAKP
jgi:hypothetical protein